MNHVLHVHLMIDQSSSMKGEKLTQFKQAFDLFKEAINHPRFNNLRLSVVQSNGLFAISGPADQTQIRDGGLALVNQMMKLMVDAIEAQLKENEEKGILDFRPWVIFLTDGQTSEPMSDGLVALQTAYVNRKISYFPFLLSDNQPDDRLEGLFRIKKPVSILNQQYDRFFHWLLTTIDARLQTPMNESMRLNSQAFEGWAEI